MKHFLNICLTASLAVCLGSSALGQCTSDYDFGDLTLGVSPNPELGETFDPGVLGLPYEDILHILLPQYVLDIDSTLPFSPTTPLDSASLSNIVLVDLSDTLSTTTLGAVGLQVNCNNNGHSGNACSFLGGNQYCASITGTPVVQGSYRVDIYVNGDNSVTVGDLLEILAEFGCTEGCTTDISGDGSTTVSDLLELLSVFGASCG